MVGNKNNYIASSDSDSSDSDEKTESELARFCRECSINMYKKLPEFMNSYKYGMITAVIDASPLTEQEFINSYVSDNMKALLDSLTNAEVRVLLQHPEWRDESKVGGC